ncbi:methyl-accepting chemotaxis protein [Deinococcus aerophilus]|uniref:Methyl-accepting chemotaxis-like protein n=1 Tax=Deinococcus aerophilus TaxID=522488 RepID=A0ABQ2GJX9_9DEIO|nr:methyl-accepting chemotaxis protein [Deinococcus aerophilus]GGL98779.1 methyl-accepting chemotaxis-like protein [Deinococcus aerophilus]
MLQKLPTTADPTSLPSPAGAARPFTDARPNTGRAAGKPRRALGLLDRLSVAQKLGLAGILFAIPTVVLGVTTSRLQGQLLQPVNLAHQALPFAQAVDSLHASLSAYALSAGAVEGGGAAERKARDAAGQNVTQALQQLQDLLSAQDGRSANAQLRAQLRQELPTDKFKLAWDDFRRSVQYASPGNVASSYGTLQPGLENMLADIARLSQLEVGAGRSSIFALQQASLNHLTTLRFELTQAELLARSIQSNRGAAVNEVTALTALIPLTRAAANEVLDGVSNAVETSATLPKDLVAQARRLKSSTLAAVDNLSLITEGQTVSATNASVTRALQQAQTLSGASLSALVGETRAVQYAGQRSGLGIAALTLTLVALAIMLLLAILRHLLGGLRGLTDASRRLSTGDFSARVQLGSTDELGQLGRTINKAAAQLQENELKNEQDRLEAAQLQANVGEFLDVTMDIADGDLTRRGKVTENVLGNVVDSINLMTEELAGVLQNVQQASRSVTGGSQAMLDTTEQIRQGLLVTAQETERAQQQAHEMTEGIRRMSAIAQASADSARRALEASEQGQLAVTGTLEGISAIRESSRGVAERVQSLTQRSEQIQDIVDSIGHIASQVNLLSLHASIEAAGAGEAGYRFAVVAEEVRGLADLSTEATARIATLIAGIQADVQDVAGRMQANTAQVEQGYLVAGQAGERLREIGELAQVTAQFAQDISGAAQEQVQGVQHMSGAVGQIAAVAQQSQHSAEQGRNAAEGLQQLADRLGRSLARFRLPG